MGAAGSLTIRTDAGGAVGVFQLGIDVAADSERAGGGPGGRADLVLDEQSGGETIRVKKRIRGSLLAATLPFGSALAAAPKEKSAKVTLV